MSEECCKQCGGCPFRSQTEKEYQKLKETDFLRTVSRIKNSQLQIDSPIFISDGNRRRADMKFYFSKNKLELGFNEEKSHKLVDVLQCPMLTSSLNQILTSLREFLVEFCQIKYTIKNKKKLETKSIQKGSIKLLNADNGVEIILVLPQEPVLEHRLLVAEFVNKYSEVIRFSWSVNNTLPETIAEKAKPKLYIGEYTIEIPQNVFLQASKQAENEMIRKVKEYMGETRGKIADLFCGLGTFTYPLAQNNQNEILSVDSFEPSLGGLQKAINQNQINNVKILNRNLFKYPLDVREMKGLKAIVMDPPRAGAHEQCREISQMADIDKPEKIIFVSCNPQTFVYDADMLISSGYTLERLTLVDQFVYSKHQELIALFTFNSK